MAYQPPWLPPLEKEEPEQKDLDPIPGAVGGALAALATHQVAKPFANIPLEMYEELVGKRPITSPAGTPLERLAEFTRAEVDAISDFAKKKGVQVPILAAAPPKMETALYQDPVTRKFVRIELGRASVPAAMHEIGHATPIAGSQALADISRPSCPLGRRGTSFEVLSWQTCCEEIAPMKVE
jgi:hypothetical protein